MAKFTCAKCGKDVEIGTKGEVLKRPCGHDDSGVLASVEAVCKGLGGLNRDQVGK